MWISLAIVLVGLMWAAAAVAIAAVALKFYREAISDRRANIDVLLLALERKGPLTSAAIGWLEAMTARLKPVEPKTFDPMPVELEKWIAGWRDDWAQADAKARARELFVEHHDWSTVMQILASEFKMDTLE